MIRGWSSFSGRLWPAITARGFSDSSLSRAAIHLGQVRGFTSAMWGGRGVWAAPPPTPGSREGTRGLGGGAVSLLVPSTALVGGGDAANNGVHPSMAEGNPQPWPKWIAALDKLE